MVVADKQCSRCDTVKPVDAFGRNRSRTDGLQDHCRACRQAAYRDNREQVKRAVRANYLKNRDARLAYARDYRKANRERLIAYQREWHARNRERANANRSERYQRNLETERQYRREWHARNAEDNRERARIYYELHGEQKRKNAQEWGKRNPEKKSAYEHRRRARRLGNGIGELVDRRVVLARSEGLCGICGLQVDPLKFDVDHIVPVSRGGEESYTNTQAAHPSCNRRKGARLSA